MEESIGNLPYTLDIGMLEKDIYVLRFLNGKELMETKKIVVN